MSYLFKILLSILILIFGQKSQIFSKTSDTAIIHAFEIGLANQESIIPEWFSKTKIVQSCSFENIIVNYWEIDSKSLAKGADLTKFTKVDNWLKGITNSTSKANIENIIKNWSDDLLTKLDDATLNSKFLSEVEKNPGILNYFEEYSKIISNKTANLKAVELEMYALDKSRTGEQVIIEEGTNS